MPFKFRFGIGGLVLPSKDIEQWHNDLNLKELMVKLQLPQDPEPEPETESESDSDGGEWTTAPYPQGVLIRLWTKYEEKHKPSRRRLDGHDKFVPASYIWGSETCEREGALFMLVNGPVRRIDDPPEPGKEGEEAWEWLQEIGYEGRAVWAVTGFTPRLVVQLLY